MPFKITLISLALLAATFPADAQLFQRKAKPLDTSTRRLSSPDQPLDEGVGTDILDDSPHQGLNTDVNNDNLHIREKDNLPLNPAVGIGGAILVNSANGDPSGSSATPDNPSLSDLRNKQQAELDDLRNTYDQRARKEVPKNPDGSVNKNTPEYQKLKQEYGQKHTQIREKYTAQDPRVSEYNKMDKNSGVKSTGSTQKDVRSDGDLTPDSDAAFDKKKGEWQNRGDKVVDKGHKVVNETTDETMWKNDPKGQHDKAKIQDPDAVGTAGGRKSVGDKAGGITDAEGMTLDHEKKYLDGQKRGNLKDQAKAVTKAGEATGVAKQNPDFYDKAKNLKNYGDDVTAGVTDLGDSPETRQKKLQEFQKTADAEMAKIKKAGAEQGARTQNQRQEIANQAKTAENAGDKAWADAKKKANYGDQPTTSEAIEDRVKKVKDSNATTAEQNKTVRDNMNKGPKADADGPGGTRVTDADGPGARPTPDADGPGGAPKAGAPAPTRGAKIKAAAGTAMTGMQIMNTAQDIKEIITSDDPAAEAKKKALQQVDGMTGDVRNKGSDYADASSHTDQANKMNQQAYQTQLENKLRRMGVAPAEAGKLAKDYAAGNTKGYEDRMGQQQAKGIRDPKGDKLPEKPKTETVSGDDTVGDRAADLGKGLVHGGVRAGTFVKDAVTDTAEIASGLTGKGVVDELVGQKKDAYNNWQDKKKNEQNAADSDAVAKGNAQDIYNKLRARGASDAGARHAADALAKGNSAPLHTLVANLNEKKRLKEAEGKNGGTGAEKTDGQDSALGKLTGARDQKNAGKTRDAMGNMQANTQTAQGSTAGDQEASDAKSKINQAGQDAHDKQDQTGKQVAAGDRKDSLGNKVGQAVADGLTAGASAAGSALGSAAATKTAGVIFDNKKSPSPDGGQKNGGTTQTDGTTIAGTTPGGNPKSGGGGGHGGGQKVTKSGGSSKGKSGGDGSDGNGNSGGSPMITCPGCGKTIKGIAGQGVECPNCVTMTCPRCSHSKNYPRGQEPESCPMCYTTTCSLCGSSGYARRDQPTPQCPNCIRIRCSNCSSILYQGSEANKPAGSIVCKVCTDRAAAAAPAAAAE